MHPSISRHTQIYGLKTHNIYVLLNLCRKLNGLSHKPGKVELNIMLLSHWLKLLCFWMNSEHGNAVLTQRDG